MAADAYVCPACTFLSSWERTVRADVCSVKLPKKKEREDEKLTWKTTWCNI